MTPVQAAGGNTDTASDTSNELTQPEWDTANMTEHTNTDTQQDHDQVTDGEKQALHTPTESPKKRFRFIRWTIRIVLVLLLAGVLITLALPGLVSSGIGTRQIIAIANTAIPGKMQVKAINLGWFTHQSVQGFALLNLDDQPVVQFDELKIPTTLLALATYDLNIGEIKITGLKVDATMSQTGRIDLIDALMRPTMEPKQPEPQTPAQPLGEMLKELKVAIPANLAVKLNIENADLKFTRPLTATATGPATQPTAGPGRCVAQIKDLNIIIDLSEPGTQTTADIRGKITMTQYPENDPPQVMASVPLNLALQAKLFDPQGQLLIQNPDLQLTTELNFEQQGKINRLAQAWIGPGLTTSLSIQPVKAGYRVKLQAKAAQAKLDSQLDVKLFDNTKAITTEMNLQAAFQANHQTINALAGESTTEGFTAQLDQSFRGELNISKLTAGVNYRKQADGQLAMVPDYQAVAAQIQWHVTDFAVKLQQTGTTDPISQNVAFKGWRGKIDLPDLTSKLTVDIHGQVDTGTRAGLLYVIANAEHLLTLDGQPDTDHLMAQLDAGIKDMPLDALAGIGGQLTGITQLPELLTTAVGNTLNAGIQLKARGSDRIDAVANVDTQQINVNLPMQIKRKADRMDLTMTQGQCDVHVQPKLLALLNSQANQPLTARLEKDFTMSLKINHLKTAVDLTTQRLIGDQCQSELIFNITDADFTMLNSAGQQIGQFGWNNVNAHALTDNLQRWFTAKGSATIKANDQQGAGSFTIQAKNLLTDAGTPNIQAMRLQIAGDLDKFPLMPIQQMAIAVTGSDQLNGFLTEGIGPSITAKLAVATQGKQTGRIRASVESQQLNGTLNADLAEQLNVKLNGRYVGPKNLINRLLKPQSDQATTEIAEGMTIDRDIQAGIQFSAQCPNFMTEQNQDNPFNPNAVQLALAGKIEPLTVTGLPPVSGKPFGPVTLHHLGIDSQGTIADLHLAIHGVAEQATKTGFLQAAAGGAVEYKTTIRTKFTQQQTDTGDRLKLSAAEIRTAILTRQGSVEIPLQINDQMLLSLKKPAVITAKLSQPLIDYLQLAQPGATAPGPAELAIHINQLQIPLQPWEPTQLAIAAEFMVSDITMTQYPLPPAQAKDQPENQPTEKPDQPKTVAQLKKTNGRLTVDGSANHLALNLRSDITVHTDQAEASDQFAVQLTADRFLPSANAQSDAEPAPINAVVSTNLPMGFIDTLGQQDGRLVKLIGRQLKVDYNINLTSEPTRTRIATMLHLDAQHLKGRIPTDITLTERGTLITANTPQAEDLVWTPPAGAVIRHYDPKKAERLQTEQAKAEREQRFKDDKATLYDYCVATRNWLQSHEAGKDDKTPDRFIQEIKFDENSKVYLKLEQVWVLLENNTFTPAKTKFAITLAAPKLVLTETPSNQKADIADFKIVLQTDDLCRLLTASVTGQLAGSVDGNAMTKGNVNMWIELLNLFDDKQQVDLDTLTPRIMFARGADPKTNPAKITGLPVGFLDAAAGMQHKLTEALGAEQAITLWADARQTDRLIDLRCRGKNTRIDLAAMLDKQWQLKLTENFNAVLQITPKMGGIDLSSVNPVITAIYSARQPVSIQIKRQANDLNFCIPLKPYEDKKVVIPLLKVDLAQIEVERGQAMTQAMKFLKIQPGAGNTEQVWVTPMELKINNGIATFVRRTDLLIAQKMALAIWGDADIVNQSVDMVIGIPGWMLRKTFDLKYVNNDMWLQVPIQAGMNDLAGSMTAGFTRAGANIGTIVAREQAEREARKQFDKLVAGAGNDPLKLIGIEAAKVAFSKTVDAINSEVNQLLNPKGIPAPSINPLPWHNLIPAWQRPASPKTPNIKPGQGNNNNNNNPADQIGNLLKNLDKNKNKDKKDPAKEIGNALNNLFN